MQNIDVADAEVRPVKLVPMDQRYLAPWWHTALFVMLVAAVALCGGLRDQTGVAAIPKLLHYLSSIMFEWMLLATAVAGLYHRRTFFNTTVLRMTATGMDEAALLQRGITTEQRERWLIYLEALLGLGVFITGFVVMLITVALLGFTPLRHSFNHKAVTDLMPVTWVEMPVWIAVCISAGFCEEMVFRGYLQRQLRRWTGRVWIAVPAQAVLFGCVHFYEGTIGMVAICALGLL